MMFCFVSKSIGYGKKSSRFVKEKTQARPAAPISCLSQLFALVLSFSLPVPRPSELVCNSKEETCVHVTASPSFNR